MEIREKDRNYKNLRITILCVSLLLIKLHNINVIYISLPHINIYVLWYLRENKLGIFQWCY